MSVVREQGIFYTVKYTYSLDPSPELLARQPWFRERDMKKQWMLASVIAAALLGGWLVLHGNDSRAQSAATGAPPEVTVAQALSRRVSDSAQFTGQIQAVNTVQVQPRVSGFVEAAPFQEGSLVHKGELLFQLDTRPYQAEVDRLSANQAQARAELSLAETNQRRAVMLLAQHAVAQQEADRQDTAEQSARAKLAASTAALAAARLNLDFTQVRSPIDGRVSNARVTPGNLVNSSEVLTSVVSVNPVYVYFDVDEQTWLKLDHLRADAKLAGHSARIEASMGLADETGHPHLGRLDFVDNQLHSGSGTMRLRAVFNNADGVYTPGLYARVQLQSGPAQSRVLVDDRAIGTDLGNQFVYVVDKEHKVQYRKVDTGPLFHGLRVIDSGVQPTDLVVVNGLQRVRPGVEVNPQKVAMTAQLDASDKALVERADTRKPDAQLASTATPKHPQG
ncbi:MAG: efflux RND transporter periplasmic adaptor subunit [Rhodanobacter sp.]